MTGIGHRVDSCPIIFFLDARRGQSVSIRREFSRQSPAWAIGSGECANWRTTLLSSPGIPRCRGAIMENPTEGFCLGIDEARKKIIIESGISCPEGQSRSDRTILHKQNTEKGYYRKRSLERLTLQSSLGTTSRS